MKTINYKWLMLEFNIYKPSAIASLSVSAGAWWLDLSLSFIFFYLKIDVDKDNIEINELREERKERIKELKQAPVEPCKGHQVDLEDMIKDAEEDGKL